MHDVSCFMFLRKLLEGEECRYSIVTNASISVPYIYRQSPVYTLPCNTRHGGSTRRAEPQYKFVEEIITETTREDVEIDETESEETIGEMDSLEKVSSEEEADAAGDQFKKIEEKEAQGQLSDEVSVGPEDGTRPEEKTDAVSDASDETKRTQPEEPLSQPDAMKDGSDADKPEAQVTNGASKEEQVSTPQVQTRDISSQETKDAEQSSAMTEEKSDDSKKQHASAGEQKPACVGLNDSEDLSAESNRRAASNANAHEHSKETHGKTTNSSEITTAEEAGIPSAPLDGKAVDTTVTGSEISTSKIQSTSTPNNKGEKPKALKQEVIAALEVDSALHAAEENMQTGEKALNVPAGERKQSLATPQTESTEKASAKMSTETANQANQDSSQARPAEQQGTAQEGPQKSLLKKQSPEEKPLEKPQTVADINKEQAKDMKPQEKGHEGKVGEEKLSPKMSTDSNK